MFMRVQLGGFRAQLHGLRDSGRQLVKFRERNRRAVPDPLCELPAVLSFRDDIPI